MPTPFEHFSERLTERERETLFSTVPVLIAWIAGADGALDRRELAAAIDELIAGHDQLGASFRYSPPAEAAFARIADMIREPDRLEFHGHLMRVRDIVRLMPEALADEFRAFVLRLVLHLARASGSFLGFGDPISDEERAVITRIVHALEIPVRDESLRAALGLDEATP